jgi:N-acetylglucosaminyldiphosphoundecaprenol N-acetyl-beta-D-mannosaminyltransferase
MLPEKSGSLLGISLNSQSPDDLWKAILEVVEAPYSRCFSVVTPNPEILSHAYKNSDYADCLRQADFSLPDGMGLVLVGFLSGQNFKRFTGADLTKKLWQIANDKKLKVAILDRHDGLSSQADLEEKLKKLYSGVNFKVWQVDRNSADFTDTIQKINEFFPDLLFVSLGYPWQEEFLAKYKDKLVCKLALGIGGSLDFIIGKQKRAPLVFRKLGLEWLYRWSGKPLKRSKRMVQALIIFPYFNLKYGLAKLFRLR